MSLVLVLSAIGFLVYDAVDAPPSAPRMEIRVDSIVAGGDRFLVEFHVRNSGQTTAASLQVEGVLRRGSDDVETSEVTIDYVPSGSSRSAGLFFTHDPREYQLELRPTGYERP